jgi:imidazolonepropionase-like amidohydrolase
MVPPFPNGRSGRVDAHVHIHDVTAVDDIAQAGVVAVRDAGTSDGASLVFSRHRGASGLPIVVSAGRALIKKGGYGSRLGIVVDTRAEIEQAIMELVRDDADIIKVVASGAVSLKQPGTITSGGFGREDLFFIVDIARINGMAVMAHANGGVAIGHAVEAGVLSIEHGFFMPEAALRTMADKGIAWVPTVGALRRAADPPEVPDVSRAYIERLIDDHVVMVGKAFALGVPLAIGTDAVLPDRRYGSYYEAELAYFRRAGIPAEIVERIARAGGRKLLGI